MGECLREVTQLLAGEADFLGVKTEMIGVREHLLEGDSGVFEPAGLGQGFDVPECAQ
jgi:hypothetical protein